MKPALPLLLLLLSWTLAAHAAEGVLEINQACAEQTGCFAGDDAGFPVTIGAPGSYRLTSNLVNTATAAPHVFITSAYVTFDLGGFEVSGPVSCIGTPPGCSGGPNGQGIRVDDTGRHHVVVRNGTVRGTFLQGVRLGERATVEDVHVDDVGGPGVGIEVGGFSTVRRSQVVSVTQSGIALGDVGRAVDNVVMSVFGSGIACGAKCVVARNVSSGARVFAIVTLEGSVVRDNAASDSNIGIFANRGSIVKDNAVFGNSNVGISADAGCLVEGNTIRENGAAISCSALGQPTARYVGNVITSNDGTTDAADGSQDISAGCLQLGTNHCGTNTTCP